MSFHPGNLRTCGAALVAALLLSVAGCEGDAGGTAVIGDPATSAASSEPDPLAGAPELGICYDMTRSEAAAVTHEAPGVSCSGPHTSMTYHVGQFPTGSSIADTEGASRGCERNLARGVGLTPREVKSSILTWIWFEPSTEQWSAGARWYRCDVIARRDDGTFKPLPSGGPPFFPDGVPDTFFRCIRERGEAGVPVTCDQPHGYRWAGTFEGKGRTRPKQARLLEQANLHWFSITGTTSWWVTWPSAGSWASGDREMACYRATRS
jgi:hypothetical protein